MKKIFFGAAVACIVFFGLSFTGKSIDDGEGNVVIMTRFGGDLIISYGNGKSEILELRGALTNKAIISNDEIIIKQLNKLTSQGYEIKAGMPYGLQMNLYSILLEKK